MAPPPPADPPLPPYEAAYLTPPGSPAEFEMPPPPPMDWARMPNAATPEVLITPSWATVTRPPWPETPPLPPNVKLPDLAGGVSSAAEADGTFSIPTAVSNCCIVLGGATSGSKEVSTLFLAVFIMKAPPPPPTLCATMACDSSPVV